MRVLLDTDVMVAAFRSSTGASRQLLHAALDRKFVMLLSVPLVAEYEAVLTRAPHLLAAGVDADEVRVVLDALCACAEAVRLAFLWRPLLKDPDDDMVLETAVNGMADLLVTFNLVDLQPAARRFTIDVVSPGDALKTLRRKL